MAAWIRKQQKNAVRVCLLWESSYIADAVVVVIQIGIKSIIFSLLYTHFF